MTYSILEGDCVEVMCSMDEASVDAIVCDPPYGLEFMGAEWDRLGATASAFGESLDETGKVDYHGKGNAPFGGGGQRIRYGTNARQMQAWHEAWATEALRVLKPGGHMLAMGGDRTFHRLVCAIEDAGFEIRTTITWHYGQGFPKNLDVSKALRRALPDCDVCACDPLEMQTTPDSRFDCRGHCGCDDAQPLEAQGNGQGDVPLHDDAPKHIRDGRGAGDRQEPLHTNSRSAGSVLPSSEGLSLPNSHPLEEHLSPGNTPSGMALSKSHDAPKAGRKRENRISDKSHLDGDSASSSYDTVYQNLPRCPRCNLVQIPEGLGTALKPSTEFITMARKPLAESSIARQVLSTGTGALAIDKCRVEGSAPDCTGQGFKTGKYGGQIGRGDTTLDGQEWNGNPSGRFPANLIFSHHPDCVRVGERRVKGITGGTVGSGEDTNAYGDYKPLNRPVVQYADESGMETVEAYECVDSCPVGILDRQSGTLKSGANPTKRGSDKFRTAYGDFEGERECIPARGADSGGASRFFYVAKASRRERNAGLEGMPENGKWRDGQGNNLVGGPNRVNGSGKPAKPTAHTNSHPTVKPIALMRYLCRLITPPGGTVLDPFAGSGSTGCAAVLEGFDFIGIERESEYAEIARRRIAHWSLPEDERPKGKAVVGATSGAYGTETPEGAAARGRRPDVEAASPELEDLTLPLDA